MKLITVFVMMGLGVAIIVALKMSGSESSDAGSLGERDATSGFIAVPMPDGVSDKGIVIFAPANCPSDAAQRAEALAQYLRDHGIRYVRASSAEYSDLGSREEVERVTALMNGPIPVVYVNGKAKANPRPEEVEAEYLAARWG